MGKRSHSFELLSEKVQRWVWKQGWTSLREIQENAIPEILKGNQDVIISASTAGGKTEAAFLPILSSLLEKKRCMGYEVLYVSPLKALINDQYTRLKDMSNGMGIDIIPWHGDISSSIKTKSLKNPSGILIITPESLESLFINRSHQLFNAFSSLQFIVIDELHYFIGSERGKQLQSLLSRLEYMIGKRIPRIAMSATFSDFEIVKHFLRNNNDFPCSIPNPGNSNHETRILIKEYIKSKNVDIKELIGNDIFRNLRGTNNLVFANTRNEVEEFAVRLSDKCNSDNVPNEFRVHHGSISKTEKEILEHELQKGLFPITTFCTSTLELGVDIGKVKSIAQIGIINSVSSLRQRLGRSGRRNEPSLLRIYSIEGQDDGIYHDMRTSLVQNIATVELMREHKYETPPTQRFHLSTLIQQILSLLIQYGCFYPKDAWLILCKNGTFKNVTVSLFLNLLKDLGNQNIISQMQNGQIVIGKVGEKIVNTPDFYVVFKSPKEYQVVNIVNSKVIGSLPYVRTPDPGRIIFLGGKRWRIDKVIETSFHIMVSPVASGGTSAFGSEVNDVDNAIAVKMLDIYKTDVMFPYLDDKTEAKEHLTQARTFFNAHNLSHNLFLQHGNTNYFFTWAGTKINRTIQGLASFYLDISTSDYNGICISGLTHDDLLRLLHKEKPNPVDIAECFSGYDKEKEKYDGLLSDNLLNIEFAKGYLDIEGTYNFLNKINDSIN